MAALTCRTLPRSPRRARRCSSPAPRSTGRPMRRPRPAPCVPPRTPPASMAASTTTVRVRYAETDRMGVVYYANYFVWFEVARTDWLRTTGWSYRDMESEGLFLPVLEAYCTYQQAARYDDDLEVRTAGILLSPVRVQFTYEV